jgi:WD40 repeat protein
MSRRGTNPKHRPGAGPGPKLSAWLEEWRRAREQTTPGFLWLRSLRPPEVHLGTAQQAVFRGHEEEVTCVAVVPNGRQLATASADKTVRIWDIEAGEEVICLTGHRDRVWSVAFSPDGGRVVSGSWDKSVRIWDAGSGVELAYLRGHRDRVWGVAWSRDGLWIASGSDDERLRLWDAVRGEQAWRVVRFGPWPSPPTAARSQRQPLSVT